MASAFDLVIRNGMVVDGSGTPPQLADIGIRDGLIAYIGPKAESCEQEINAYGQWVTPGFIDIHTHYDGQVTWENTLQPSSLHGVTTVITGNCGVGFAPCKPEHRAILLRVMEGVEDIPEIVMTEGLPWNWQTFPEYLDALSSRQFDIDVGTQIPHSAIRVHVMGERGEHRVNATPDELLAMTRLVREAIEAGALGVSSSHHPGHRTVAGDLAPSVMSTRLELLALAQGLREAGQGVFQMITDGYYGGADAATQMDLIRDIARSSGQSVSFTLVQKAPYLHMYQEILQLLAKSRQDGLSIQAQVFPRPVGLLFGLSLSLHPFRFHPSYQALHALPLPERVDKMRQASVRQAILAESPVHSNPILIRLVSGYDNAFSLGDPPNYEPSPSLLLHARAHELGVSVAELAYDLLLENQGKAILMSPSSNFAEGNFEAIERMLMDENTLIALGDGGAHYGMICDSSYPSTVLSHWVQQRQGKRLTLEQAVHRLSRRNALAMGLHDRGLIALGMKADLNIIDGQALRLHPPITQDDLPGGGRRIMQKADGYIATLVSGTVIYQNGQATGARPGRLIRQRPGFSLPGGEHMSVPAKRATTPRPPH